MNLPPSYTDKGSCVTIVRRLTKQEYEEVGLILWRELGRHKSHGDRYIFYTDGSELHILETLLIYLRKIKAPHTVETTLAWPRSPKEAT